MQQSIIVLSGKRVNPLSSILKKQHNSKKNSDSETIIGSEKLRNICLRYERELTLTKDWMFWFLLVWTTVLFILEWVTFLKINGKIPETMTSGYIILLGAYIVHKEINRWAGIETKVRRGEFFVYMWWTMFLAMFIIQYVRPGQFELPHGMAILSYEVLGYFMFGEISKAINRWQRHKQHEE